MLKNKYLQDIGITVDQMSSNYNGDNDPREGKWKLERAEYGFDERETWCLDRTFAEWLYSHLMMYVESCCIDLKFYKFEFENKTYTQEEAINFILSCCKEYLLCDGKDSKKEEEVFTNMQKAIVLFSIIFPAMWW